MTAQKTQIYPATVNFDSQICWSLKSKKYITPYVIFIID